MIKLFAFLTVLAIILIALANYFREKNSEQKPSEKNQENNQSIH